MAPKILICGTITWAKQELKDMFEGIAEVLPFDCPDRPALFKEFATGGKYADIVGLYRDNTVLSQVGNFDKELIDALPPSLKWIASNGAGYDMVDALYLKEKGISLSNTPGAVDDATATTALYLIISCMRQYSIAERSLRKNEWKPKGLAPLSHDLTGKTLAILGMGGIGIRIAQLARAFPMRVIYHNRRPNADAPEWCEYVPKVEDMLAQADVLSVSVPLNANTVGLVGEKYIRALKKGSIIVNTARGKVIDEDAMIRALEDGHLGSVGLDVYPNEPEVNPRLLDFPHITLLPHMGTENQDTQRIMEVRALRNLVDYITKGKGNDLMYSVLRRGLMGSSRLTYGVSLRPPSPFPKMQSGRSTPHPQAPVQDVAMRASASLQTMMKSMAEMHKAMPKWEDVSPTMDANENDVLELQKQINTAKNNDMKETTKIKRSIGESLYSNIREKLRQDIQEQIKLEVKRQTQLQVDQRIAEYIPISLKTQLLETEVKTDEVSASLKSSTARKSNSAITIVHNIDDPLGVVLTKNGEKSTVYPQDLRSFYGYEPSDVEKLLADYGLEACDSPTENSNRFLDYIGVSKAWRQV